MDKTEEKRSEITFTRLKVPARGFSLGSFKSHEVSKKRRKANATIGYVHYNSNVGFCYTALSYGGGLLTEEVLREIADFLSTLNKKQA